MQVLRKYIPMPATLAAQGVTEAMFYANISSYWANNRAAFAPFDPVALTAELETEMLQPMDTLRPLFEHTAYLTRLATFISPEEMTTDPLFVTNALLPDVPPQHNATAHLLCGDKEFAYCDAPVSIALEDGRNVLYAAGACGGSPRARTSTRCLRRRSPGTAIPTPKGRSSSITAPPSHRRSRPTTRRCRRPARVAAARCARARVR